MRVLVIGAGALGDISARLLETGKHASLLVRPARAAKLNGGLFVKSPVGDISLADRPTVTAERLKAA